MTVQIFKWHLRWGGVALAGALALFGVAFSGSPGGLYAGLAGVCLIFVTMAFVFTRAKAEAGDRVRAEAKRLDDRCQDRQNRQSREVEGLRSAIGDARKEFEQAIQEERNRRTKTLFLKPYQSFLRRLREDDIDKLVKVWAPRLGVEVTCQQLRYVQHRIACLEDMCLGRLAGHVQDVALRVLAARGLGGQELHIIEVGVLFGVNAITLYDLLSCYYRRVQLTLIDPLEGCYGEGRDEVTGLPVSRSVLERNLWQMGVAPENLRIVQRPSNDPDVLAELGDCTCQFLFIDGDHSYEGVRNDLEKFAPLVANGGLVVFHDYHNPSWPEVTRAVDELAMGRKDLEFVGAEWETAIFRKRSPDLA